MKIVTKRVISAYAGAIVDILVAGNCNHLTTEDIEETLRYLLINFECDPPEEYHRVEALLRPCFEIAAKYCEKNKVLDLYCDDFLYKMLELICYLNK